MTAPEERATTLEALFAERYAELTRLAYLLTGDRDQAEDLAQDAFLRAWPRLDRLRNAEAAPAYLRATVVNLVKQGFRRRLVERKHAPAPMDPEPAPDEHSSASMDLARIIRELPIRKRACVVLRYYADLSEEETAAVLGVSVGTVKSQTHRALRQLAKRLDETPGRVESGGDPLSTRAGDGRATHE
ncbi:SigE family RNA polymerase sigma factor [Tenggerimyces flavus]|uniref:SigE family RNA polymerase sigma factor n=1 Tax=Tenggerimyces flavus TaxID=1708749 RepID=A0ABV7YAV1_9ACTN|nr:SigE family RNA polymerase sigma factor [Tenggerimyces flavus]MBM7783466.1 RNA polymerase sigma-70 factor (sigma-E family) [Tenggerimyces flavus]